MTASKEKKKYNVRVPKMPGEQKTWTFTLSLSGMITVLGSVGVALSLFFILGLLVGRGYQPEQSVPQLAAIMPSQHGAANATKAPSVLKAEELTYPETLAKAPKQVGQPEEAEPEKPKPTTTKKAKPATTAPKAEQAAPAAKPEAQAAAGQKIYDYTYQAASFRKQDMAKSLRTKLAGAGLNAVLESADTAKGTWYRVLVRHRGTPDSTAAMKSTLNKFGIARPLMKRKKLVAPAQ